MMTLLDEMLDADDLSEYVENDHIYSAISADTIQTLEPRMPITLPPETTLSDAISLMQEKRIGAILITQDEKLVGIFTERDILFKLLKKDVDLSKVFLKDYMTPKPIALYAEDKIAYALNQMTVGGFRHIPIVDERNQLTGIISVKDIVEYLANLVPDEVYNIRPEPLRGGFQSAEGG